MPHKRSSTHPDIQIDEALAAARLDALLDILASSAPGEPNPLHRQLMKIVQDRARGLAGNHGLSEISES